jgi:geranylgeranyl diphosphate synthase, type I
VQPTAAAPPDTPAPTPAAAGPEPESATAGDAAAALARARRAVDPVLRAAVATLPAAMCRVAAYHLGWQDAVGRPVRSDPGKAIRPALVFAAARAHAAAPEAAARAAAAVELAHNFTLLHDDVMDRDATRRHRPTAWSVFGVADAILAGDAVNALALRLLAEDPHPAGPAAAARLAGCVAEICEGQHEDCAFEAREAVALEECLRMAEAKTGALLGCACALGALYAQAPEPAVEAMDGFGRRIGLAFQLADDLIGIWGDPRVTGKPAGADLAARKKSLPVVAALASGTPHAADLAALYRAPSPLTADQVRAAAEAVERAGGRDWAQARAADYMADAIDRLALAVPDPDAAEDLLTLAELATRRDR